MEAPINLVVLAIGYTLLGLILLAVAAEIACRAAGLFADRFLYEKISRHDYIDAAYHPYLDNWLDWSKPLFMYVPVGLRLLNKEIQFHGRVVSNELGFRTEHEFSEPKDGEFRVLLMGGSAAWGSGATTNQHTIAGQLEMLLNNNRAAILTDKPIRVYNMAQVNGYQTQDILNLALYGPQLKPDIVVSFTGWNELVANYPMKMEILRKYGVFYITELEGWSPVEAGSNLQHILGEYLRMWFERHTAIGARLKARWRLAEQEPFEYSVGELESRLRETISLFRSNMEKLTLLSNALGAYHIQCLQPNLYWKSRLTESEASIIQLYDEVRPAHGGKAIGDYLRQNRIHSDLAAVCAADTDRFGQVLDLSDIFSDDPEKIFYTLVHMTDAGYRKVAENIFDRIAGALPVPTGTV